ncbi:hypothetical protein BU26DRAFT_344143 [Trematosphaeria pertusa]|uniref:Uncharacterized protein n=1 Tax=Trematosphaeria pertusa TaxID=390896 RepID=A0A6A6ICK8_9PLEO|nr:uncharacterized protein BU26DRAFT_344143 [Trematosphaeria pertusa]KAF2247223.1 hypothetical protein BU26DRAFT_344143 [Trematosphaeria pertusa]
MVVSKSGGESAASGCLEPGRKRSRSAARKGPRYPEAARRADGSTALSARHLCAEYEQYPSVTVWCRELKKPKNGNPTGRREARPVSPDLAKRGAILVRTLCCVYSSLHLPRGTQGSSIYILPLACRHAADAPILNAISSVCRHGAVLPQERIAVGSSRHIVSGVRGLAGGVSVGGRMPAQEIGETGTCRVCEGKAESGEAAGGSACCTPQDACGTMVELADAGSRATALSRRCQCEVR